MPTERACPVCGLSGAAASVFLAENIDASRLSASSYASRKLPEYMSHRLLRCPGCALVYAPCPPAPEQLAAAYRQASYDSAQEAQDAADAYFTAIAPLLQKLPGRRSALEIGTGTAAFLEHLARAGFARVTGVEPSEAAIAAAPAHRRGWIRPGVFEHQDFAPESFDLVCCFMTLEHVADPAALLAAAWRLLRPGGAFVSVTHDYRSPVNRLLGKRSPIIDIEHLQLFCEKSLRTLFARAAYADVSARAFANRYAISYWLRLTPLPPGLKAGLSRWLDATALGRCKLSARVGNTLCLGFKPRG